MSIVVNGNMRVQFRRDTAENWEDKNPVLLAGEIGLVTDATDENWLKFGDGVIDKMTGEITGTCWNKLPYRKGPKGDSAGDGAEFIFDGGGATQNFTADMVIDTALSETSSDAIANKAVAIKVNDIEESISDISATVSDIEETIAAVWNAIYPVGSIYLSVSSTSPAALFGGTWEQIKDSFLLAAGDTYTAGDTGGEAEHTLTINEMPEHNHTLTSEYNRDFSTAEVLTLGSTSGGYYTVIGSISNTGGDQPHNNMPPYLTVYMWKRTA